ncbi:MULTISPECIES: FUSC family protein [Vibrio]|uniref:FUSC family protein n=1 Tax=Vibrio ostreae TaxID=2841925 RepID=A0A975U9Q7_9VIBR|nr:MULTISPECIES: FUSC family protein [Vibrio]QXO16529.1 FUSC family protein [Vibrio ostreae]
MGVLLNTLLMPNKQSVIFAIKGVVAMALSLYIAMFLNLDRPYWALVSAVFLQIRPESGLVIEKGICQIVGTLVGGIVGITILQWFMPYPELAIGCLALWLGINSGMGAMVRRTNFIYLFAMAGITACLIVLLVMVSPATASSQTIFAVAQARVSEIIVGAICAALVSKLVFPMQVKDGLRAHARHVINQTLSYLNLELDPNGSHDGRHQHVDTILESIAAMSDDQSAVVYEGPDGPGQSRAASQISNKTLSLLAMIQIFGRLQRNHPDLIGEYLAEMLADMRDSFKRMEETNDYNECYKQAQSLRRRQLVYSNQACDLTPLQSRLMKVSLELSADLVMILKGYNALISAVPVRLNAPTQKSYKDPLVGLVTGGRTMLVFLVGAGLWIGTGSTAVLMMMILPVIFSIMLARLPMTILMIVLQRLLVGVMIAVPVAVFYGLNLLAQSSGDYEILVMVLAGPYFFGLMALANRATMPYGLGFCIPFTILISPSNDMSRAFSVDYTLSNSLSIFVGVTVLYWMFKMITGPGLQLMQYRLLRATKQDLSEIMNHPSPEHWFNARMGDRLLRIATYDKSMAARTRDITELALTGLNLGHVSVRLRRMVGSVVDENLQQGLENWQNALAEAFMQCSKGQFSSQFNKACNDLLTQLRFYPLLPGQYEIVEGMCERLTMTFERLTQTIADNQTHISD